MINIPDLFLSKWAQRPHHQICSSYSQTRSPTLTLHFQYHPFILHPPSSSFIILTSSPPIIITILIISGIGSNRQYDGEISTLFFDIQRKTLSDCSWLQTHENVTFATMTPLLRGLHTIINIHIITLINIREAVRQDFLKKMGFPPHKSGK